MGVLDRMREGATRAVVAPDGYAYRLRRVRSADLAEHQIAELVGMADAERALRELQAEQQAAADQFKIDHMPPDEQAKHAEKKAAQEEHNQDLATRAMIKALTRNPGTFKAHQERIDAYCCAGIVGVAEAPEGAEGVISGEGIEWEPVRFVLTEQEADPAAGAAWVGWIDQETRSYLADMVSDLSRSPSVRSFRGESGATPAAGSDS